MVSLTFELFPVHFQLITFLSIQLEQSEITTILEGIYLKTNFIIIHSNKVFV